jgi:hypothetical protein
MCIDRDEALSEMQPTKLASLCIDELKQLRSNGTTNDRYCIEILRRAIIEQTDQAWSLFQQCFSGTIRVWIYSHPNHDVALLYDSEENLIAQTFSRFWYAVHEKRIEFTKLVAALCYLRSTLNGILIDILRSHLRMQIREVSLPELDCLTEPTAEDPGEDQSLWKSIESLLSDERERRIAYLLYCCGLKPREIVICCAKEFDDVKEIYRLNHNIIERLRRNRDRLRYIFGSDE